MSISNLSICIKLHSTKYLSILKFT